MIPSKQKEYNCCLQGLALTLCRSRKDGQLATDFRGKYIFYRISSCMRWRKILSPDKRQSFSSLTPYNVACSEMLMRWVYRFITNQRDGLNGLNKEVPSAAWTPQRRRRDQFKSTARPHKPFCLISHADYLPTLITSIHGRVDNLNHFNRKQWNGPKHIAHNVVCGLWKTSRRSYHLHNWQFEGNL